MPGGKPITAMFYFSWRFSTKPQTMSERIANAAINYVIFGRNTNDIDYFFGPRAMTKEVAKLFEGYDGVLWDQIFVPIVDATYRGYRITGINVPYSYPDKQRRVEETMHEKYRNKRTLQRREILLMMANRALDHVTDPKRINRINQLIDIIKRHLDEESLPDELREMIDRNNA